jgi:hypothetical protein
VRPVRGQEPGKDACDVSLALIGDFLTVFDKGGCDGLNVSFTGLYLRQ